MRHNLPIRKRAFDLATLMLASSFVVPALMGCIIAILLSDGRPVFYRSKRRVYRDQSMMIAKFRTMRRDAEKIVNRKTVAIEKTRFLNIGIDSPLYSPVGRWIERLMLTELPQLLYVFQGRMSLVGNRPLPENVIDALKEGFPEAEARFGIPTGLTGPVQLVGRDAISDSDRLRLEAAYCDRVMESYSVFLDLKLLLLTAVVGFFPDKCYTADRVFDMMRRTAGGA